MQKQLSVSQLNNYIKGVFDDELILQNVCVFGEIFEFKMSGGNSYIVLKEGDCVLNCAYFGNSVNYPLGVNVAASGSARYYLKGGKLSFIINSLRIVGDGELIAQQVKTKNKLEAEGVFKNNRPLKPVVKNIALITSGEGAVLHDFLSILKPLTYLNITVFSVNVQGIGAADGIICAINRINSGDFAHNDADNLPQKMSFDVVVIARGGGSHNDLDEFNNEALARSVFAAAAPVISAVGHETDYTLCDYAADYRAGTPSMAAELIVKNNGRYFQSILHLLDLIKQKTTLLIGQKGRFLYNTAEQTVRKTEMLIDSTYKKCVHSAYVAQSKIDKLAMSASLTLKDYTQEIYSNISLKLQKNESEFKVLCAAADKLSPMKILSQGYAKVTLANKDICNVDLLSKGDNINIVVLDGEIAATVASTKRRAVKDN